MLKNDLAWVHSILILSHLMINCECQTNFIEVCLACHFLSMSVESNCFVVQPCSPSSFLLVPRSAPGDEYERTLGTRLIKVCSMVLSVLCNLKLASREETPLRHVAMVAKVRDLYKRWFCKYGSPYYSPIARQCK